MGTTVLVASMRDEGHTFHERRTPMIKGLIVTKSSTMGQNRPSLSSTSSKLSMVSWSQVKYL